jgi:hypothetical protein
MGSGGWGVEAITWYFDQRELQAPCSANDSNGLSLKGYDDTHSKNHPRDKGGDEETVRHGVYECSGTRRSSCGCRSEPMESSVCRNRQVYCSAHFQTMDKCLLYISTMDVQYNICEWSDGVYNNIAYR